MIFADGFDVDAAQEWALQDAQEQGCTCSEEPKVFILNCEVRGVRLAHGHEKSCVVAFFAPTPRRHELIAHAEWN